MGAALSGVGEDVGRMTGSCALDIGNRRPRGGMCWLDTWLL
jgi:hypothetical protein